QRLRRTDRRGGAAPVHLAAAGLRESAQQTAGQAAAHRCPRRPGAPHGRTRPPRARARDDTLVPSARAMLAHALSAPVVGSPETVKRGIEAFARRTNADELMGPSHIFNHSVPVRAFETL